MRKVHCRGFAQLDKILDKLMKKAISGEGIYFFITVPEGAAVWGYSSDAENHDHADWFISEKTDDVDPNFYGVRHDHIKGLLLETSHIRELLKNKNTTGITFEYGVEFLSSGELIRILGCEDYYDAKGSAIAPKLFLFPDEKTNLKFSREEQKGCEVTCGDFYVAINPKTVQKPDELRKGAPLLFTMPSAAQKTLSEVKFVDSSKFPRLTYMWDAYRKTWGKNCASNYFCSDNIITEKHRIKKEIITTLSMHFEGEHKSGKQFSEEGALKDLADILQPDYMYPKNAKYPETVSKGLPSLFYIINCIAEMFGADSGARYANYDISASQLMNILIAINNPAKEKKLSSDESKILNELIERYECISYLWFVRFTSSTAKSVAKIFQNQVSGKI